MTINNNYIHTQDDINEIENVKIEEPPFDYVVEELVESQQESHDEDQEMGEDEEEEEEEEEISEELLMAPLKRSRMENLEPDDGMIYNCEICPKTFGKSRLFAAFKLN